MRSYVYVKNTDMRVMFKWRLIIREMSQAERMKMNR